MHPGAQTRFGTKRDRMTVRSVDTTLRDKLLQKFQAAVRKEFKTGNPTNIEDLIDRLLLAQPDLKALTVKVKDKKGNILKKAEVDRDCLRKIIAKEIREKYN